MVEAKVGMLMYKRGCDIIFGIIIFSLIFITIPNEIRFNFLGGIFSRQLMLYPLLMGILYTIYCQWKYKNIIVYGKPFAVFLGTYLAVSLISTIWGLYTYPYYAEVLHGPIDQIEKLPYVAAWLRNHHIMIDEQLLAQLWMVARIMKSVFQETLWAWVGAYIIFCWYCKRVQDGVRVLLKALYVAIGCVLLYSLVDVFYLAGNETAKSILITINPYMHEIKNNGTWWPPLLWPQPQLRSLFAEPSYLGIFSAFAAPMIWYSWVKAQSRRGKILIGGIWMAWSFCLFLTQARTGVALLIGEAILLLLVAALVRKQYLFRFIVMLICITGLSFGGAIQYISFGNIKPTQSSSQKISSAEVTERSKTEVYFDKNVASLASTSQRSNGARYSTMIADFRIGMEHPLLGVGTNLRDAYIPDYLPDLARNNGEVQMWLTNQQEKGILKASIPRLGEYTSRFAENGLLGLIIFLFPPVYLAAGLLRNILRKKLKEEQETRGIFLLIALAGTLAAGIGDTINITYCYWIILGLGYAFLYSLKQSEQRYE